jgi:hypothetical protein
MAEDKRITYKDVMDLERELINAPVLLKEEQDVKDKKEALSVLKKGILVYLRKGYSIQAVVETINNKFPQFEIADADVRKILPKVTKKKRAPKKAATSANSDAGVGMEAIESDGDNSDAESG